MPRSRSAVVFSLSALCAAAACGGSSSSDGGSSTSRSTDGGSSGTMSGSGGSGGGQSGSGGDGGTGSGGGSGGQNGDGDSGLGGDGAVTNPDASTTSDAGLPPATCSPPLMPADVSHPKTVVGTGTAASCTSAALASAIAAGGVVTFACGGATTITVSAEIAVPTDRDTVIDGGGMVTLDGGNASRILHYNSGDYRGMYGGAQHVLTVQNITFAHGKATGTMMFPPANPPCSQGYQDGQGGAILMTSGTLHVINAVFTANFAADTGPDVGGGAIYSEGSSDTTIVGSRFSGNGASNGGAAGMLNSNLTLVNDVFDHNQAEGQGANSTNSTCPVVGGQRETGSGGNGGAICIDGGDDGTVTICGTTFSANSAHALGGAMGRTPDGAQQTTNIDRSTFDGNSAVGMYNGAVTGSAGALYFHNSHVVMTSSTLSNNSAPGSGGFFSDSTTLDATNSTFVGNTSTSGVGGAIASSGSLSSCTFANNQAQGTNYAAFAAAIFGGPWVIDNTLFANNTDNDSSGNSTCAYFGGTNSGTADVQWPQGGTDSPCVPSVTFADPMLGALGNHGGTTDTVVPQAAKSVVQIGTSCPATDQTGKTRATPCTVGAVEVP